MGGVNLPEAGKRTLDFDLNLVPFIDLLSCCISFLLITAAWTQLARLETVQKVEGPGATAGGAPEDKVQLVVFDWGYELLPAGATESCAIPKKAGAYDEQGLRRVLQGQRAEKPAMTIAVLAAEDKLDFVEVVGVMDVCVDLGLINVSLGQAPGPRAQPAPCRGL